MIPITTRQHCDTKETHWRGPLNSFLLPDTCSTLRLHNIYVSVYNIPHDIQSISTASLFSQGPFGVAAP